MSTHRITIELPEDCYRLLRQAIEAGDYGSESEAISDLTLSTLGPDGFVPGTPQFDRWMREEVLAADDEMSVDPSTCFTLEQVQARLAEARVELAKAG